MEQVFGAPFETQQISRTLVSLASLPLSQCPWKWPLSLSLAVEVYTKVLTTTFQMALARWGERLHQRA